jgi:hypothetical protein
VARNGDEFTFVSTVPAGPAGPAGTNGTNGVNGNLILTGASAPTAGTGSVNDWYINTATWMLYGPKGALGWPTGVSLIGPAGPQGPAGGGGGAASSGAQGAIQFSDGSGGFSGGSNATLDNAGALEANAVNFRRLRTRNISASNGGGLSGTITFDLGAGASVIKHDINGDATFAAANYTGGEMVSALITNTGGAAAVLTWDAALIFVGTKPSTLAAGKRLLLSITAYDGATLIAACAAEL